MIEELHAGDIDDLPVATITGIVETGEQHSARAPRELVAEGVVIGLGRRQTATVGLEGGDLAAIRLYPVDHLHRGHVVDAGIDAELVEEDHTLFPGLGVQRRHLVLDVRGGHHVLALLEAGPGHLRMELPRQQAHRHVVVGDDLPEALELDSDVVGHRSAVGVAVENVLRLAHRTTGDRDLESMIQQIAHMSPHHQAGTKYDDSFHLKSPSELRAPGAACCVFHSSSSAAGISLRASPPSPP